MVRQPVVRRRKQPLSRRSCRRRQCHGTISVSGILVNPGTLMPPALLCLSVLHVEIKPTAVDEVLEHSPRCLSSPVSADWWTLRWGKAEKIEEKVSRFHIWCECTIRESLKKQQQIWSLKQAEIKERFLILLFTQIYCLNLNGTKCCWRFPVIQITVIPKK